MRIRVVYIGKPRSRALNEAAADYAARIARYCDFAQQELRRAGQVRQKFPRGSLVALDPAGRQVNSAQFAEWLGRLRDSGTRELVFLVGGAEGLPDELRAECQLVSLSSLTFPHELARVMLLEQIYRAFTILHHHPYPK
jgi:23S rRNA (pseudouridine1915-N3)-methyltransferase